MNKLLISLVLLLSPAAAWSSHWPWQSGEEERLGYCRGFVVGGLASMQVAGGSRIDLWLAWNYLVRSGPVGKGGDSQPDFIAGRANFEDGMDPAAARARLDAEDGQCGLGRGGRHVTGW